MAFPGGTFGDPGDMFDERQLIIPRRSIMERAHWTVRWWKAVIWLQTIGSAICLVCDGISEAETPDLLIWHGYNHHQHVDSAFWNTNISAAYWANGVVLGIGIFGIMIFHSSGLLPRRVEVRAHEIHAWLCIVAVIFCATATAFATKRWHAVSKTYLGYQGDYLGTPFALSVFTTFLQVIPGAASLFGPILSLLAVTETEPPPPPKPVKTCGKKLINAAGTFRDVHNDHGIQWTLVKPTDLEINPYESPNSLQPEIIENFESWYKERKEEVNQAWREQLRKSRPSRRIQMHSDPKQPLSKKPSIDTDATIGSEWSELLHPTSKDKELDSACAVSFGPGNSASRLVSPHSSSHIQHTASDALADTSSEFIRELIMVNMRQNEEEIQKQSSTNLEVPKPKEASQPTE